MSSAAGSPLVGASLATVCFPDYATARDDYFWPLFYVFGGETLYCGHRFGPGERAIDGRGITLEHAYPADWIAEALGCPNRNDCAHPDYGHAEADLHNLWPAIGNINSSRQDVPFGEIPGETARRFETYCPDYERTSAPDALVEPRDEVKGDLARSILYMLDAYELPLHDRMDRAMLLRWHAEDPPDETEIWRNYVIESLQGARNPFIHSPIGVPH